MKKKNSPHRKKSPRKRTDVPVALRHVLLPPESALTSALVNEAEVYFPIVGIGASAGGLDAISRLLKALPRKPGIAFVVVQHLQAEKHSDLPALLGRASLLPVKEVLQDMVVEPDQVYVIPADRDLEIRDGVLRPIERPSAPNVHLPIDHFLRSLATDVGPRSVGVILSGTATDGVLGLKAIKIAGGITFAQDEKSAQFFGMPGAAKKEGYVDFVLSPEQIADEMVRIGTDPVIGLQEDKESGLRKVFTMLAKRTGVDFLFYKHSTLRRRLLRRMLLLKITDLDHYIQRLEKDTEELDNLYQDLLIQVTNFFRDPETFDGLKKHVFPALVKNNVPGSPIRIWIPGCSTGEEAYSIAICLMEFLDDKPTYPIQIFGTDISESAIARARAGLYPENIKTDVSQPRLRRFFVKTEGGYQISKNIRDLCVFARQNVTKEPPFSRLDLISCRNLLIYLGTALQKKIMPIFHYALKPHGFLMLGTSESVGGSLDLFALEDKKNKIYSKKSIPTRMDLDLLPISYQTDMRSDGAPARRLLVDPTHTVSIEREADAFVLNRYSPAGVIVNENMEVIQFRGRTALFLEHPTGLASLNILKMAKSDIALDLRSAIQKAFKENRTVRKADISLGTNGQTQEVAIEVIPLKTKGVDGRFLLVLFQLLAAARPDDRSKHEDVGNRRLKKNNEKLTALHRELEKTREDLQAIIEEQEVTNEELKTANEEIQSSNEELQSTNEELETAKEELQSTNEELTTVNEELQNRNFELSQVNNDLTNVLSSVNIPIVMLGADLRVRRFTPMAERLLNLIPTDIGRPISDIKPNIEVPNMEQMISDVIDRVSMKEMDVQDRDGRWYLMRIQPYKTREKKIDGATLAFVDIDTMKRNLEEIKNSRDYAEAIVESLKNPKLMLDENLKVVTVSKSYLEKFRVNRQETVGNLLTHLGNGQWANPKLRTLLDKTLTKGTPFDDFRLEHAFEKIGHLSLNLSGRRIVSGTGGKPMLLLQIEESLSSSL